MYCKNLTWVISECIEVFSKLNKINKTNAESLRFKIRSKWNLPFIKEQLKDYHDQEVVKYLEFGWPISHTGKLTNNRNSVKNHNRQEITNRR